MPKLAANLSMMFQEVPFLDRFARGGGGGLQRRRVSSSPMISPPADIAARLERHRSDAGAVQPAARRLGQGRARLCRPAGPRGRIPAGARPGARLRPATDCKPLHAMAGHGPRPRPPRRRARTYVANLQPRRRPRRRSRHHAASSSRSTSATSPAISSTRPAQAMAIIEEVGARQPQAAARPLSLPDHGGRSCHAHPQRSPGATRMCRSPASPSGTSPTSGEVNFVYLLGAARRDRL